jgi:hypothetical protein
MRPVLGILAVTLVPAVLACTPQPSSEAIAMTPADNATTSVRQSREELLATVEDVDMENRMLTLRRPDGGVEKLYAPPEVKNLPQVKIGDQVFVTYLLTVTAIPRSTTATSGPAATEMVVTAPEGSKPGIARGTAASTVVTMDDYDPATHIVTFTNPQGMQRQGEIMDPKMQAVAASLKKGDRVEVILSEVAAITVRSPAP